MKFISTLIALGVAAVLSVSTSEGSPLAAVLRLVPGATLDDYRQAMTQREAAMVSILAGEFDQAEVVLRSIQHYSAPGTIAEAVLTAWEAAPADRLSAWIVMGTDKMGLMAGRDDTESRFQLASLSALLEVRSPTDPSLHAARSLVPPVMLDVFHRRVDPPWWQELWGKLDPRSPWAELKVKHTEEEKRAWKMERMADGFTARLLLAEALRRVREGQSYPQSWLRFALGGIDAVSFNSDPTRVAVGLYRLALAEKRGEAESAAERVRILFSQNSPTAFGAYESARLAAWACGPAGQGREELLAGVQDMEGRVEKNLNEYEKMLLDPQLGAARALLGDRVGSEKLFTAALLLADRNTDPESKLIGLIRLNLGYVLAGRAPSDDQLARMRKVQADAEKG